MDRSSGLVLLLAVLALLAGVGCSGMGEVTLRVSHAELQESLDEKFPIEKEKTVFKLLLSNPRLALIEQSDQLQMTLTAQTFVMGAPLGQSEVTLRGGVRYDKESKAFYLTDAQVTDLDVAHIPERYQDKLRKGVDVAVHEIVPVLPVYRLNKDSFKHSMQRAFLKRAWIDDHVLHLEMGI